MITRRQSLRCILAAAASKPAAAAPAARGSMMWDHLVASLRSNDETRRRRLASVNTLGRLRALQTEVRDNLRQAWGPFPERTPLNPRLVGVLEKPGYVIEKIIFESRPKFYVTANLYRPKQPAGRLPAVIFPLGHSNNGKAYESYQRFAILMARQGFVLLTWDPVGQGERLQLYDPVAKVARAGVGTREHEVLGRQCYLLGINLMQYRVWDAIRAIDYLETRADVDPGRIACAGQSGGGMETLQLAPFEPRLKAAIPACAVASFRHKSEALLIADPEQILYDTLGRRIDHPELLAAFAPRPLLIEAAIQDFVPIAAARATFQEVKRVYKTLGAADKVAIAETDDKHSLNRELREAAATWLTRWLAQPRVVQEEPATIGTDEELACTPTGQVVGSLGGETVQSLNLALAKRRKKSPDLPKAIQTVTRVGRPQKEAGIEIPTHDFTRGASALARARPPGRAILVVAEQGMDHPEVLQRVIQPLANFGNRVIGVDVRGWGRTAPNMPEKKASFPWESFFAYRALELGRPLFGQRLGDLLTVVEETEGWSLVGIGAGALLAAHAAVLDARIRNVVAIRGMLSYRQLLEDPFFRQPFSSFLPGVIGAYEVRDLYAALDGRKLLVVNPEDSRRQIVPESAARQELSGAFTLHTEVKDTDLSPLLLSWFRAR